MSALRVIDLFSGAGGLSLGFSLSKSFEIVSAVELDLPAAATYAVNHPKTDVYAGAVADWIEAGVPSADIVIGGPPCQGFSSLGTRNNRDPRNALWRRYVDVLVESEPLYFVLENVSNFLKSGQFGALVAETRPRGRLASYRIEAHLLNAVEFGVPQVRKRAIVIGSKRNLPPPGAPTPSHSGRNGDWRTVRDAIGDLDLQTQSVVLPDSRWEFEERTVRGPFKTMDLHLGRNASPLSQQRYEAIPPGGNRMDLPERLKAPCWRRHTSGSGDVMGRLHWDRPSVTIRTEFWKPEKGRYLHPEAHRPITLLEGARLQGFPDDYLWCGSKTDIGRQIGNAVPVELAGAVAGHLEQQLT